MMEEKYNPYTCGHSVSFGGIFICSLETVPCAIHKDDVCYSEKIDRSLSRIAEKIRKIQEDEDVQKEH